MRIRAGSLAAAAARIAPQAWDTAKKLQFFCNLNQFSISHLKLNSPQYSAIAGVVVKAAFRHADKSYSFHEGM